MSELTPERLAKLRRVAETAKTDGTDLGASLDCIMTFDPTTALALLDRIEALESFVLAEKAVREHAEICVWWGWKPGACPNGVCRHVETRRDEAYIRAMTAMGLAEGYVADMPDVPERCPLCGVTIIQGVTGPHQITEVGLDPHRRGGRWRG